MTRKPDTPCSQCGTLLWRTRTSAAQPTCRPCRRSSTPASLQRCGRCKQGRSPDWYAPSGQGVAGAYCKSCRVEYARERRPCSGPSLCTDCGKETSRRATAYGRFCSQCAANRKRTRESRKVSRRRTAQRFTDITAEFERELRRRTRRCRLCQVWMTGRPDQPNSKQLDHIVPIVLGGTHTIGNVRIICRTCNLQRPRDGSDLDGHQPTLWAQDIAAAEAITAKRAKKTTSQSKRCRCRQASAGQACTGCAVRLDERRRRADVGREAARMRAAGAKWQEISDDLSLSGPGTAYQVAIRFGEPEVIARWPRQPGRTLAKAA